MAPVLGVSGAQRRRRSGQVERRRRTVADYLAIAVLDDIEERRPFHEIVEVEVQVVVLGQGIEVGQVQAEQVGGRHAPDRGHGEVESAGRPRSRPAKKRQRPF